MIRGSNPEAFGWPMAKISMWNLIRIQINAQQQRQRSVMIAEGLHSKRRGRRGAAGCRPWSRPEDGFL
jgi:hypothetical protein